MNDSPIFLGLSHIGQVFSIGWALKFGACATFDFDPERRMRFQRGELTEEEPELTGRIRACIDRITLYETPDRIADHSLVFLTLDTPLNVRGEPDAETIMAFVGRCVPYLCRDATLVLLSQVYPGFCARIQRELFVDRQDLRLVYMVDTLQMGAALSRFFSPEQLIFGAQRPEDVPSVFQAFRCPIQYYTHEEAEMVKVALNVYLAFSVTFANAMDNFCRQLGLRFAPITAALRHDARIGQRAYLTPSLGVSGGHLERDLTTLVRQCADKTTKQLFEQVRTLNEQRMTVLYNAVERSVQELDLRSLLWVGISYKPTSCSLVNSPFLKFVERFRESLQLKAYDSYYPVPLIDGVIPARSLAEELARVDGFVFHYANAEDIQTIQHACMTQPSLVGFEISLSPVLTDGETPQRPVNVQRVL